MNAILGFFRNFTAREELIPHEVFVAPPLNFPEADEHIAATPSQTEECQNQFKVLAQPKERWEEIANTVMEWQQKAFDNELKACDEIYPEFVKLGKVPSIKIEKESERLTFQHTWIQHIKAHPSPSMAHCRGISLYISQSLHGIEGEAFDTILVSRDLKEKIHGIALYNQTANKLVSLVAHPDNIDDKVNHGVENRVKGAGTSIMLHLFRKTMELGIPLKVDSTPNAKKFYEKFQFDLTGEQDYRFIGLELSADKINELIKRKIPPFHLLS